MAHKSSAESTTLFWTTLDADEEAGVKQYVLQAQPRQLGKVSWPSVSLNLTFGS